jgi:DNA repair protein RadD
MYQLRDYQNPEPVWEFYRQRKGDGQIHNALIVMPTGAGKSIVVAAIVKDMLERFGGRRVLVLTHQKELIAQNFEKLQSLYPQCEPGIYSASLGRKQTDNKVIFAGIQSVHNKAHQLGDFSLILIDECHTIPKSGGGMYRRFIDTMNRLCGKVPVIGLTATPYRMDSGFLHKGEGALFTDIALEVHINDLLERGYLCPLTTKRVGFVIDATGVKKRGGEYITEELEALVDPVTEDALADAIPRIEGRKSGIVFCVTVKHAHHVSDYLNAHGITCAVVSGETPKAERDRLLIQYKSGGLRCLANVNVLTTGFDAPATDFLIMLRPTQSPGLYVQMGGRGMRLADGKYDCLVLDYAGNIQRHGPIDAIQIREKKSKGDGEAPVKVCPQCETIVHASLRTCECGYEFPPPALKIEKHASKAAILSKDYEPEWVAVDRVSYSRWPGKDGKPDTMRVDYWNDAGLFPVRIASEFVCVFHPMGWAREKAHKWCARTNFSLETIVEDLLNHDGKHLNQLMKGPSSILLDTRGKYATIVDYQFDRDLNHDAA